MHDLSDWHVLIVDDEPDNIGVLELVFTFYQAAVSVAESGRRCLEILREQSPTVLLVDIQMPGMSGYELLRKIRESEAWKHLPVIAITAHVMPGDDERALAAGFDGYIPKPINAMSIADEVQAILKHKGQLNG